jgi:hypothetical protein
MSSPKCSWCGVDIGRDEGFRAIEPEGERAAAFCRLEHVVPWAIQGARWEPGTLREPGGIETAPTTCAHCGETLADDYVLIVRHRGEHRIPDAFCSADHLAQWAKHGGRWGPGGVG